jgi:hypothetical protein
MAPGVVKPGVPPSSPPVTPGAAAAGPAQQPTGPVIRERRKGSGSGLLKLAALLVLAGGAFYAWKNFISGSPTPAAAEAPAKEASSPPAPAPLTPSDTLNQLAHAPANAINQAQDVIAARRESGQARIDAASIGEDLPDAPVSSPPAMPIKRASAAPPPAARPVTATTLSPGVTATAQIEFAPDASAPFRSFVANAKVSGVFQGPPTRAMINGRITRSGEVIDSTLGITFEGVDSPRRLLLFKDGTGATVSRRF